MYGDTTQQKDKLSIKPEAMKYVLYLDSKSTTICCLLCMGWTSKKVYKPQG